MVRLSFLLGLALLTFGASSAPAATYRVGEVMVLDPWIRPTPPGAPTAAGYVTVTNHGAAPDRLLGGTSPAFKSIEIHQMTMDGQIMRMRPIAGGLLVAPGQSVILAPRGDRHLMLVGPSHPIKLGDRVPVTLQFAEAGAVNTVFVVREVGAPVARMRPMSMSGMDRP